MGEGYSKGWCDMGVVKRGPQDNAFLFNHSALPMWWTDLPQWLTALKDNSTFIYLPSPAQIWQGHSSSTQNQWVHFQKQKNNLFCLFPPSLTSQFDRCPEYQSGRIAAAGGERFWDKSARRRAVTPHSFHVDWTHETGHFRITWQVAELVREGH